MKCGEIKELLSEYVDGVLDPETMAIVDGHLSDCKDCQRELSSLRALVSALESLDTVEPPRDFLHQLHQRIEKRSRFSTVLHALFVPLRVKIPLELAGAAAMAILVFAILHTQQDELKLTKAPVGLKQEWAAEKVAKDESLATAPLSQREPRVPETMGEHSWRSEAGRLEKEGKEEAYKPQLARAPAEQPPAERETIELALVMKGEGGPEALKPEAATEAAPAPKKEMKRSLAMQRAAPSAQPERDVEVDDALPRLTRLIERAGGKVVSIEYEKGTKRLESINAEIPAPQLNTFYDSLKPLGDLETVPTAITGKGEEVIPVHMRLVYPE